MFIIFFGSRRGKYILPSKSPQTSSPEVSSTTVTRLKFALLLKLLKALLCYLMGGEDKRARRRQTSMATKKVEYDGVLLGRDGEGFGRKEITTF